MALTGRALAEDLYAFALTSSELKSYCNNCLKSMEGLKKCSACEKLFYCSQECQRSDWKVHKAECKAMQSHKKIASDSMRLAMRIIALINSRNYGQVTESYLPSGTRSFLTLIDHADFSESSSEYFCAEYTKYALPPHPDPEVIKSVYKKISINGFGVTNSMGTLIGHGLCIKLSAANHSCKPLTRVCFRNRTAMLVPIYPNQDPTSLEGACHSYIDELQTVSARQAELKKKYNFTCVCEGCMDEERNEKMEAWSCGICAKGLVPNRVDACCESCGWQMTQDHYEICRTAEESAIAAKSKIENDSIPLKDRKELCEKLLELFDDTLHEFNVYRVLPHRLLFYAASIAEDVDSAQKHGKILLAMMVRYQGKSDPIVMLKKWQIAQLCYAKSEYLDALRLLREIQGPLEKIYSSDSPVSKNIYRMILAAQSMLGESI